MRRRKLTAAGFSALMPLAAHAHPGNHADMHGLFIGLHHAALPLALFAIVLTGLAISTHRRKRSRERVTDSNSVGRRRR
jgi:hypothetical protein